MHWVFVITSYSIHYTKLYDLLVLVASGAFADKHDARMNISFAEHCIFARGAKAAFFAPRHIFFYLRKACVHALIIPQARAILKPKTPTNSSPEYVNFFGFLIFGYVF